MVGIPIDAELVMLLGHLRIVSQEVKRLAVPKVGWDALGIELTGVLEVLDGLLVLAQFTEECRVMQTRPEVFLVKLHASL